MMLPDGTKILRRVGQAVRAATEAATPEVRSHRWQTCLECEYLLAATKTCKRCGCFMPFKTALQNVSCPIGKWDQ